MTAPVRSCVGCRQRHSMQTLLRLQVDQLGRLSPSSDPTEGRRTAWVCHRAECVRRIQRNPKGLYRALRQKGPDIRGLQDRILHHMDEQAAELMSRCHRHGLLVSGRGRLLGVDGIVALIAASDASQKSLNLLAQRHPDAEQLQTGLDRNTIGALIGKKERAVVGARQGRSSELLRESLRRRGNLS